MFACFSKPLYTTRDKRNVDFWRPIQDPLNMTLNMLDGGYPRMIPVPFQHRIQFWETYKLVSKSTIENTDSRQQHGLKPSKESILIKNVPPNKPEVLLPPGYDNVAQLNAPKLVNQQPILSNTRPIQNHFDYQYTPYRRRYYK